jgi:general nucleoside transport system permease protein
MLVLEPRLSPSPTLRYLTPIIALALTMVAGMALFAFLGKEPVQAIKVIFIDPLFDPYSRSELLVKAAPLALIATGLALGFRAGVWNIGAGGQMILGAIFSGSTALAFYNVEGVWILPLMAVMGMLGGWLWAMIPAFLKNKYNTSEILVSLMLVYVAVLLLSGLVSGPLRDPDGFNFPESRIFHDSAQLPILLEGTRVHLGVLVALIVVNIAYVVQERHILGYQIKLMGESPKAAAFGGVQQKKIVTLCLGTSGALAGLAGMFEIAGSTHQLTPDGIPYSYGFTAIIVAFLGRLHPVGILIASLILALTIIGGETAQFSLQIPKAAIDVFQGMLLFFLLGADIFASHKLRFIGRSKA